MLKKFLHISYDSLIQYCFAGFRRRRMEFGNKKNHTIQKHTALLVGETGAVVYEVDGFIRDYSQSNGQQRKMRALLLKTRCRELYSRFSLALEQLEAAEKELMEAFPGDEILGLNGLTGERLESVRFSIQMIRQNMAVLSGKERLLEDLSRHTEEDTSRRKAADRLKLKTFRPRLLDTRK